MEEIVSHDVFARAVRWLGIPAGGVLRVLDVGCGTGDGLSLLTEPHGDRPPVVEGYELRYQGLDAEPTMVDTARTLHPEASFEVGDIRDGVPTGDFDLYLSCGVPYSHLTAPEIGKALGWIFDRITRGRRRAVVLVDVLGRYSVEWVANWGCERWDYAMTFFEDTEQRIVEPMTFFSRDSLGEVITGAADSVGAAVKTAFTDRSVLVGRHTATRAFNASIPPYRSLLNELFDGVRPVAVGDLVFTPPDNEAPDPVAEFFKDWATRWNGLVHEVAAGADLLQGEVATDLAARLLRFERDGQRGLGAGHSLTATVFVDGAGAA